MGSLYWHRDRVLVAVGASGVAVCRMRRGGREDVREPGSQDSLAVPELSGPWALHARRARQCQRSTAKALPMPIIFGSANPGWRGPLPRQGTLAVPELSGSCQINLAVPILSGAWAIPARRAWQRQRSTAPHLANSRFLPHPSSAAPAPPSQRCSSRRTSFLRPASNSRARSSRWAT